MIWLIIGYMWLFIHRPFEEWQWLGDYRVERVSMIVLLACWCMATPRLTQWNRMHRGIILFVSIMLASWLISPFRHQGRTLVENYLKYLVFYLVLITSVHTSRQLRLLLAGFIGAMALFMLHSANEWLNGRAFLQQGIVRMGGVGKSFADQNDFAGLIVMSLPFAWVLWQDARRFSRMLLVGYFGLALWCVMRTGSRMGACGVAAAAAMAIVALPKRYRLRIVLVAPLVVAAVWLVLPQEIQRRYLTIVDSSYGPANAAKSADNRSRYFWIALDLFQERPLLGYGPGGFLQASGVNQAPHNVYGQVLSELGCLGALAFCLILFGMAQNSHTALLHTSSPHMLARRTALAASAAVALALGMGWGLHFLYWHVWLWFAAFQVIALKCLVPVWSVHSYSAWQPNRPSAPVLHSKWQQSL